MIASRHTQSLSDFRKNAAQTIDRLNASGEAEILTVNGEARAVLISPAVYDDLARQAQLSSDVTAIRTSMKQIREGKFKEADAFFDQIQAQLLAKKPGKSKGTRK